jgi:DNA-directed RNA polymerase specialized sigma24 family protein
MAHESVKNREKTAIYRLTDIPLNVYFWRIFKNKMMDFLRKKYKIQAIQPSFDPHEMTDLSPKTEGFSFNPAFQLLEILEKENPDYEALIRLQHYVGMSYKEIAESKLTKYTTEESCKSNACKAMKRLRDIAHEQGVLKK